MRLEKSPEWRDGWDAGWHEGWSDGWESASPEAEPQPGRPEVIVAAIMVAFTAWLIGYLTGLTIGGAK